VVIVVEVAKPTVAIEINEETATEEVTEGGIGIEIGTGTEIVAEMVAGRRVMTPLWFYLSI